MNTPSSVLRVYLGIRALFWLIAIGLCIKAGTIGLGSVYSVWVRPESAAHLFGGLDLLSLRTAQPMAFALLCAAWFTVTGLQAFVAFQVLRLLLRLDLDHPFEAGTIHRLLFIALATLATGMTAVVAEAYAARLGTMGFVVSIQWSGGIMLFFAAFLYVLARIFQHGLELQTENNLTV